MVSDMMLLVVTHFHSSGVVYFYALAQLALATLVNKEVNIMLNDDNTKSDMLLYYDLEKNDEDYERITSKPSYFPKRFAKFS